MGTETETVTFNTTSMIINNDDLETTISMTYSVTTDQTDVNTEAAPPTTRHITSPSASSSSSFKITTDSFISTYESQNMTFGKTTSDTTSIATTASMTYSVTTDQTDTEAPPPTTRQITSSSASSSSSFKITTDSFISTDESQNVTFGKTSSDTTSMTINNDDFATTVSKTYSVTTDQTDTAAPPTTRQITSPSAPSSKITTDTFIFTDESHNVTSIKTSTNTTSMRITNNDVATTVSTTYSAIMDQTDVNTESAPPTTNPTTSSTKYEGHSTLSMLSASTEARTPTFSQSTTPSIRVSVESIPRSTSDADLPPVLRETPISQEPPRKDNKAIVVICIAVATLSLGVISCLVIFQCRRIRKRDRIESQTRGPIGKVGNGGKPPTQDSRNTTVTEVEDSTKEGEEKSQSKENKTNADEVEADNWLLQADDGSFNWLSVPFNIFGDSKAFGYRRGGKTGCEDRHDWSGWKPAR
ncbi:uncharacterized protein [Amphiura filiformis]|uniref:uncharacterized protein n=1 Tax=Amphiura filiformis TaxID=82378 RepID=UPI003B21B3E9